MDEGEQSGRPPGATLGIVANRSRATVASHECSPLIGSGAGRSPVRAKAEARQRAEAAPADESIVANAIVSSETLQMAKQS
jgi:hypothetical protein